MWPHYNCQMYRAERRMTDAERRAADVRLGELAADCSALWHELARPARAVRNLWAKLHAPFVPRSLGHRTGPRPAAAKPSGPWR